MPKPTDQMFFDNTEDSAKRKPLLTALEIQKQKHAKLDDDTSASITKLEKSIARAHFVVGQLVLQNPELFALVKAHLEKKQSSAYKVVQEYTDNVTQVAGLKELLRR
jgi:phosphoenolpyruvate-protein kinase (PTS system EI component)